MAGGKETPPAESMGTRSPAHQTEKPGILAQDAAQAHQPVDGTAAIPGPDGLTPYI